MVNLKVEKWKIQNIRAKRLLLELAQEALTSLKNNNNLYKASSLVKALEDDDIKYNLILWFEAQAKVRWRKKKKRFVFASTSRQIEPPLLFDQDNAAKSLESSWNRLSKNKKVKDKYKQIVKSEFRSVKDIDAHDHEPLKMDMGFAGPSPRSGI